MPESRRDTGQRRPLPDIGAMQDTGRSPLHLLLDDRASRDGACGSDRRRRARGLARQPRTLRRQEDQGRPGKEGGVTASRRRIGNIMREQGMTSAYARRRSEPHRTRVNEARPANLPTPRVRRLRPARASGWRPGVCEGRERMGLRVPAGRPGGQGHRRPFRRTAPGRKPGIGRVRHPRLPADGRPGVPHRPGQRVRQHEDRRAARRVRHQKIAVAQGQPRQPGLHRSRAEREMAHGHHAGSRPVTARSTFPR